MVKDLDFSYPNAPLVEIIAEMRWRLTPVPTAGPNAALDPHYDVFSRKVIGKASQLGYPTIETVIPDQVPRELIAHTAVLRFRKGANQWPVLQVGPGVITVNQAPPYQGWRRFASRIDEAFELLSSTYPLFEDYITGLTLTLRYVNGFRRVHGMEKPGAFIREGLRFGIKVPQELSELIDGDTDRVVQIGALDIKLHEGSLGDARFEVGVGAVAGDPAVVAVSVIQAPAFSVPPDTTAVAGWYDQAHMVLRKLFHAMLTEPIVRTFGEPQPEGE